MKIRLYTVHDKVAQESGPIFQAKNHSVARRQFTSMLKEQEVLQAEDYELLFIGEYDPEVSVIDPQEVPDCIMRGFDASFGSDDLHFEGEEEDE